MSETTPTEATKQNVEILFDISASAARIAASCRAHADIRYYLTGINVEPKSDGGAFVAGSNGHILGVCDDASGICSGSVIVSITKELYKALPRRVTHDKTSMRLQLVRFGSFTQLHLKANKKDVIGVFACEILPGKFPNWRSVIPDITDLRPMTGPVHLPYLTYPSKAFDADLGGQQVQFYQADPSTAVAMFLANHEDTLFVLMPQRPIDRDGKNVAAWSSAWADQRAIGHEMKKKEGEKAISPDAIQHTEDPDHAEEEMAGV